MINHCDTCGETEETPKVTLSAPPVCEGGESCIEIQNTACVAYTGDGLTYLNVKKGDRLTQILDKMNAVFAKVGTGMISIDNSTSISVSGKGSAESPYKFSAIIKPVANNLLVSDAGGLSVLITTTEISRLLTVIESEATLKEKFRKLVNAVSDLNCLAPTNLTATTA